MIPIFNHSSCYWTFHVCFVTYPPRGQFVLPFYSATCLVFFPNSVCSHQKKMKEYNRGGYLQTWLVTKWDFCHENSTKIAVYFIPDSSRIENHKGEIYEKRGILKLIHRSRKTNWSLWNVHYWLLCPIFGSRVCTHKYLYIKSHGLN